ncbi:hypothetical protein N9Z02_00040 [Akkermansiaceae bacterium]|nr:hypothetical protein [Akkermansiaceae bacterium]
MFLYHISLIGLLLLSCIIQQFLPPINAWYDARVLLLPLVVVCSAATTPTAGMLLLTFLGGFLWDAQQILNPLGVESDAFYEVYQNQADTMKFGYSILLFALMGFLMQGIQPLFKQGKWYLSAMLTGVAMFLYLTVEYLLFSFIRGGFDITSGVFNQIGLTALITMLASPIVFWVLFQIANLCRHEISYDSLRRRSH